MSIDQPHLAPTASDRGLRYLPALDGTNSSDVRLYESSAADEPHVWLAVQTDAGSGHAHLPLTVLAQLGEQIAWVLANHYQVTAAQAQS